MTTVQPTDVAAAVERLTGVVNRTPVFTSRTLNELAGRQIFLKCENFQRVGAFKFRGAYNAMTQLSASQRAAGVITHSSGNHAQGVALAAKLLNIPAVIVMPEDAPAIKREATAGYGARIISCPAIDRETVTDTLVAEHRYTLIHPYDNDHIIAGQGTAAWELFEEVGQLDLLLVPVGGGGLISGCALAAAAKSPRCRVIGVEPEVAADATRSFREGRIHRLEQVPDTIADGLRTRHVGQRNLAIMLRYVSDMITVSEEAIIESLKFFWQRLKIIVEPSAAVVLAPFFTGQLNVGGQRVGMVLSGGNVDVFNFQLPDGNSSNKREEAQAEKSATNLPPLAAAQERPRVLVCDPIDEGGLDILRQVAIVDVRPDLGEEELQAIIGRYQALVVHNKTQISSQVIEYGFNLRAIGCAGGWLDNVDVSTARALGVHVCYSPSSNTVAIAEHTLALMLALAARTANNGDSSTPTAGLVGKTLGIIGFGRIGRQVAQRALAFDMRVIVNQPRLTPELALAAGVEVYDLHDLLREADFVSLHVPFKAETITLIGQSELALMKPTAYLINTAHTDLIDDDALLIALDDNRLAGAALATYAPNGDGGEVRPSAALRQHPRVITANHVTHFMRKKPQDAAIAIARQIVDILQTRRPNETLSLEVVPIEQVLPHEQIDEKRVARLMKRLEEDGQLVNPPVVTFWNGRYVVLDGATRFTALQRLGYPYIIVQVVEAKRQDFTLHTWYHVISRDRPISDLLDHLRSIEGLILTPLPADQIQGAFSEKDALCYFLDRAGNATLAEAETGFDKLAVMNALVTNYTEWGTVERTLLTDLPRVLGQFPNMTAVAIFPQFTPEIVFDTASKAKLLPAGLTRFLIPGRVLHLNADLARLKLDEALVAKRAWLNQFLEDKLARSRLRYYQEPVILLDE